MTNFNSPFSVGDKVLKKSMAKESHGAKMKTKWTGPYTVVEVTAVGDINSRTDMDIFYNHIFSQAR